MSDAVAERTGKDFGGSDQILQCLVYCGFHLALTSLCFYYYRKRQPTHTRHRGCTLPSAACFLLLFCFEAAGWVYRGVLQCCYCCCCCLLVF